MCVRNTRTLRPTSTPLGDYVYKSAFSLVLGCQRDTARNRCWATSHAIARLTSLLQTLFKNLLLCPVFLLTSCLLPLVRASLTLLSVIEVTFIFIYNTLILTILHYITLHHCSDFFALSTTTNTRGHKYKRFKPRCTASNRQQFFVARIINVWNALPSTVNFTSLNVLGIALKRLISLVFSFVIFYLCDRICTQ